MIKLTPERIQEIAEETGIGYVASGGGDYGNNLDRVEPFARAIEAEILRINSWRPIETAPMDGAEVLLGEQGSGDYELARYHADMGKWLDRCSDELHFTPTHCLDPMPPDASRATGCPDTMDDTAQYAVDQKSAAEEKSPPATGPAG